jgi:hypothetical protein
VELPLPGKAWQEEQAARISCNVAATEALGLPEGEALRLLQRHCRQRPHPAAAPQAPSDSRASGS